MELYCGHHLHERFISNCLLLHLYNKVPSAAADDPVEKLVFGAAADPQSIWVTINFVHPPA